MAEEFLEEIYRDARLLCELRQITDWTRVGDRHHTILRYNQLLPELVRICKRFTAYDELSGITLYKYLQEVPKCGNDLILMGDILDSKVLPLLEKSMRQWGEINTEDEDEDFRFETTISGFLTMKDIKRNLYIHSTNDPMWEAKKLAEYIFDPKKKQYSVLGCGLGYLIYQLYSISEGSVRLRVYEKDARIVQYARAYGVLEWIPEDRLSIETDKDPRAFLCSILEPDTGFYMLPSAIESAKDSVKAVLKDIYIGFSTDKIFRKEKEINYWRNLESGCKMISEFDFSGLKKEFIVIGAGPSLDTQIDFLKRNKNQRTLIAVGTVLKKLLKNHIIPDVVVLLDPQARTFPQIEGVEACKDMVMLVSITAYWEFVEEYKGEKYLISFREDEDEIYDTNAECEEKWEKVGTVTALGIEAACQFGAEKIYLVGVDLSYPEGISHAEGTMDRSTKSLENMIQVEGVGNRIVCTDDVFNDYRKWIEEKISRTPKTIFINLSPVGAKISGTREMRCEDV